MGREVYNNLCKMIEGGFSCGGGVEGLCMKSGGSGKFNSWLILSLYYDYL